MMSTFVAGRAGRAGLLGSLALLLFVLAATGCDALISPQHRLERARTYLSEGKWGRAAIELRKVVQADAGNAQAWLLLAQLSLDAADAGDAANAIAHAAKAGASAAELDPLRARAWLAVGQPQALIDAAAHHALDLPEPDRSVALARAYNELRQPDRALALLAPVLAAHPRLTDARLTEAEALAREGRAPDALREIDTAILDDPHAYSAPLLKGRILEGLGQFAAAEQALADAVREMKPGAQLSDRASALIALTDARLAQGKVDAATQSEAPLAKLLPDAPAVELLSARVKLAHHDSQGGIADLERAVQRAPDFLQARVVLGAAQLASGNLEQARLQLEQVVQQAPGNREARKLLASVRLKLGQPEEALRVLTPALAAGGADDPQLLSLLSAAERRVGDSKGVTEALERTAQAHPQDRNVKLDLAAAYLTAGRAKDALSILQGIPEDSQSPTGAGELRRDALLVRALTAARGPSAAAALVDKLLAAHPRDRGMLDFAASYYASAGELDHARVLLRVALAANPRDVTTLLALARVDAAAGDEAQAESALRTALSAAPDNEAVRIALADTLARKRAFGEAEQLLRASGQRTSPDLALALARLQLAQGDVKGADASLDRAIALAPGRAEVVGEAGALLLADHRYDAALARFRQAAQMAPDNAEYWLEAGRAQLALGRADAARESLEKANQLQPQSVPVVSALAMIDLREKNAASALGRVSELAAAHPSDADALVLKGDVESAIGRPQDAAVAYEEAQARRPTGSVAVKLLKARMASGAAHPEEPLVQWLATQPKDVEARTALGDYYLVKHDLARAAREFQAIVDDAPRDVVALNNLAWTYLQLNDPRAETVAEQAHKLAPGAASVADTLGWILARKHETAQALPLLSQAVKADAADPDLEYHYAYVLAQQGRRAEARAALTKALSGKREFDSKPDAERLLKELGA